MRQSINKRLRFIPGSTKSLSWADRFTERSIVCLKIIWLLFVCVSLYLMVTQIVDSTVVYFKRNEVTSLTLTDVDKNETFWICFLNKFLLTDPIQRYQARLSSIPSRRMVFYIAGPYENEFYLQYWWKHPEINDAIPLNITSADDYFREIWGGSVYENMWAKKVQDMVADCSLIQRERNTYKCRRCYEMPATGMDSKGTGTIFLAKSDVKYTELLEICPGNSIDSIIGDSMRYLKGVIIGQSELAELKNVQMDTVVHVEISSTKFHSSDDDEVCKPLPTGEVSFIDCMSNCSNQAFGVEFSCTPFSFKIKGTLTNGSSYCELTHDSQKWQIDNNTDYIIMNTIYMNMKEVCLKKCEHFRTCQISTVDFSLQANKFSSKNNIHNSSTPSIFLIEVNYRHQQNVKQHLAKNIDDFLADLGGIIGLYFGFSVVGVMHLVFYCGYRCLQRRAKQKFTAAKNSLAQHNLQRHLFTQMRSGAKEMSEMQVMIEDGLDNNDTPHSDDIDYTRENNQLMKQMVENAVKKFMESSEFIKLVKD